MQSLSYIIYKYVYGPLLKLYLKNDATASFDGFKLKVLKGVFHPKLFFSTLYFYEFIKQQRLTGRAFLEIGSGSGLLSMLAYRKGAVVTAIDIDAKATENTQLNFSKNFTDLKTLTVFQSDLFNSLSKQRFDVIIINPPYFFKNVQVESQYAWYCGENGEYFERLFLGIAQYMHADSRVFMILADNCEIDRIRSMAAAHSIAFELAASKKIKWETNFIFKLSISQKS